jgi:hypothetical protein
VTEGGISIWFFIGISLLINGLLICGAGVWQWMHPPAVPLVLSELHGGVWWGGILSLIGLVYCLKYAPRKAS